MSTHVVIGGSGSAGNAISRALAAAGHTTRAVNRTGNMDLPPEVETIAADISSREELAAAIRGADVVYMAAQPPYHQWPERFPEMLRDVLDACANAGAKLVMVDNLYAYGRGHERLSESSARAATDAKGRTRAAMLDMLFEAHDAGRVTVTVGQASDYFGPRAPLSAITALAIEPAAKPGATLRWMGSLDTPHSVAYLPDMARAFVALGTSRDADGGVWILPHGPAPTGRSFLDTVNAHLETPRKVAAISIAMLRLAAPFHKVSRESLQIAFQWTEPWIADDRRFQEVFGPFATTSLDVAVKHTLDWYRGG